MYHFLISEEEVYLALTLPSAMRCAQKTSEFLSSFSRYHRHSPSVPLPLLVLRIPERIAAKFLSQLEPYYSDRGHLTGAERLRQAAQEGLAVYVYYYPSLPIRAAHVVGQFRGSFGIYSSSKLREFSLDIEKLIQDWTQLFGEILLAGWLPASKFAIGHCLQAQNLVIDGGFCDVDSVLPMKKIKNIEDFYSALLFCVNEFTASLCEILKITTDQLNLPVWHVVWDSLRKMVLTAPKTKFSDKRLKQCFDLKGVESFRLINLIDKPLIF
jgi:hypothetical protein